MNLCTCGHAETAHANGTGFCYADKRNGDPCECERYTPDQVQPELAEDQGGSQYIGQEEREQLEQSLLRIIGLTARAQGEIPDVLVFCLFNCERGGQKRIQFELICSLWTWAGPGYRMWYQAVGSFEFAGVPGREWRVDL